MAGVMMLFLKKGHGSINASYMERISLQYILDVPDNAFGRGSSDVNNQSLLSDCGRQSRILQNRSQASLPFPLKISILQPKTLSAFSINSLEFLQLLRVWVPTALIWRIAESLRFFSNTCELFSALFLGLFRSDSLRYQFRRLI